MFTARLHGTIHDIPQQAWDGFFPGDAEGWAYYAACEEAPLSGFDVAYVAVYGDAGKIVAAAPMFHTQHELYASLSGPVRRALDAIAKRIPRFLSLGVTGLGSPQVDRCHIGLDATLSPAQRNTAMRALLTALDNASRTHGNKLLAVKDLEDHLAPDIGAALESFGFAKIRSLPNAYLDLPFVSWEQFLQSHSRSSKRYFTRKERTLDRVRLEYREEIGDLSPKLHALYEQTRGQSKGDYGSFETLHPNFFDAVKRHCQERAQFMLCWLDDELIGFQLLMVGDKELSGKVIGMDYAVARELNLYFININQAIRLAIAKRIPHVRMGNTAYAVKMVYGARLATHWIFFKHRSAAINAILKRLAPLIDYERNDPDLIKIRKEQAEKAAAENAKPPAEKS